MEKVLITGGAGFIGSHIADLLLQNGYAVRILDNLSPQVHGQLEGPPLYLNPDAEFIRGDVGDISTVSQALEGVDLVCHQAAVVGVAQSMYEIQRYVHGNDCITATLLQAIVDRIGQGKRIKKLVVASSMSIYGEGRYYCPDCGPISPLVRTDEQLARASKIRSEWEPCCYRHGELEPMPTDETKPLVSESVYAIGKKVTEELALVVGRAYGIPTLALRYFNVYGPRQALSNPYTGLLAILAARVKNQQPAVIFEDGHQLRDFTWVGDIAAANLAALRWGGSGSWPVNIGTGRPTTVLQVADAVRDGLGGTIPHAISGQYRSGDIRHCYASTTRASELLGFEAQMPFEIGLPLFLDWAAEEQAADHTLKSLVELDQHGLIN